MQEQQETTWERWTPENTAEHDLEYLQFHRDLAQASMQANDYPSLNEHWQQDIQDLDQLIADRQPPPS